MKRLLAWALCLMMLIPGAMAENAAETAQEYEFVVYNASRDAKRIAVTVDDCYNTKNIKAIFSLCKEYDIPMTFFPNGMALREKNGDLWRSIVEFGCEIGNHTNTHPDMQTVNDATRAKEILKTQEILDTVLGYHYPMQVYRPPFGNKSRAVNAILQRCGYKHCVVWDVAKTSAKSYYSHTQNGSILLFHADDKDLSNLTKLLPMLVADGYEFCTVSELLGLEPVQTSALLWEYDKKTQSLVLRPDEEQPSLQGQEN